jgi:hypothetical protein
MKFISVAAALAMLYAFAIAQQTARLKVLPW